MVEDILEIVVVLGTGTTTGALFAVALSTLPALFAMPPDRYIYSLKLLGRNWDPTMPIIVLTSTIIAIVLAFLGPNGQARVLYGVGAGLLIAVSVISHFANVPINRQMRKVDPDNMPADWEDPRPLWRVYHTSRTVCAFLALGVVGWAAVVG
ncbi:GrhM [Alloactinosynnema sp. L-07]|uniref:anthrone oxygenase family protein n=1 Tax=Alloactinosynnema sp. L-07 TaxID=1653480 RepID=UPI00065EFF1C|nr:DUF1772 domain-containing protein [Alloactinosynnema sp. L-07]CRK55084.1 GrhM [Alloactinosynnema sp. L-07]